MTQMSFKKTILDYPITAEISFSGNDCLVKICGGCTPHVGSVSVAYWNEGKMALEKILLPHHRDDVVGNMFAEAIAQKLQTTVAVVCGIHYHEPGYAGIQHIIEGAKELLDEILKSVNIDISQETSV